MSIIGQTAISNLAREVAELKQRNSDRLVPVEVVVETVTPLVLTLPDGETMEGATPLGTQLEAGKSATLLIGEGRAWVWRQVEEAELQPGDMASEHLAALEQLKFESDRAEDRALEAQAAAAEAARLAQEAQEAADSQIAEIEERFEGVTEPLHEIQRQAGDALAGLAETPQDITPEYATSESPTSPPLSGWSTARPEYTPGIYTWLRFRVVRGDGSESVSEPQMTTGAPGEEGQPGPKGDDGTSVTITGRVATAAQLPTGLGPSDAGKGWITEDDGHLHIWSGTGFTDVGQVRGQDGQDGADGRSIVGHNVGYQASSSGTVIPTGTWLSEPPTVQPGWYLWTRLELTFNQAPLTTSSYSVARFGADGTQGDPGRGVSSTEVHYQLSASGTVAPTGTWHTSPQVQTEALPYLWTRTVTTYTSGSPTTAYAVSRRGDKGDKGDKGDRGSDGLPGSDGVGLDHTEIAYARGTSGTNPPGTGWQASPPSPIKGQYLWTRTIWTYTDSSTETGYSAAYWGTDGAKGDDGIAGKDGVGIVSTTITYAEHTNGQTAPTSGWNSQPPASPAAGNFIWTRTVWAYSDDTTETGYSVGKVGEKGDKGDKGDRGTDGIAGKDGVGVASTAITYAQSTSGTVAPTSGWTASVPTLIKGRYLWTKTVWTYTDDDTETGYSVAYVPQDGASGNDGLPGAPGVGISDTTITYAQSTSGTVAPTSGWTAQPPAAVAGRYVWTKTVWTYTDGSTETGYSVGKIGDTGAKGDTGSTGRGIASTEVRYQAHSSGTVVPTGTWVTNPPAASPGQYVWTRTVITYTSGTPATSTSYSVGRIGTNGLPGSDGRGVTTTVVRYALSNSGTTTPSTFTATSPLPQTAAQPYLWTRTEFNYTTGSPTYAYSVSKLGDKGDTGNQGAQGIGVSSITPFFRLLPEDSARPPTPSGATPSGWSSTEPVYVPGQELWRSERLTLTNGTHTWTIPQLSSAYTAAVHVGNLAEAATQGLVKVSTTDPGHYPGRLWWRYSSDGKLTGLFHSNGSSWMSYTLVANDLIAANSINAPLIVADEELWAKLGTFVKIESGMIEVGALDFKTAEGMRLVSPLIETSPNQSRGIKIANNQMYAWNQNFEMVFYVDGDSGDVSITGGLFANGDITGSTLTGNTIQTSATSNRGIKIIGNIMQAWNASGTRTFLLDGGNGNVSITGGTYTGGTFQTTATANRGVKIDSTGVRAYDTSGNMVRLQTGTVEWLASTGGVLASLDVIGSEVRISGNFPTGGQLRVGSGILLESTSGAITWSIAQIGSDYRTWRIRGVTVNSTVRAMLEFAGGRTAMPPFSDAPNITMNANGFIGISTSSARFKDDILPGDWGNAILDIEPSTWIDKASLEMDAKYATRTPGVIAEDVDAAGLNDFVTYDDEGRPTQVSERLWVALIPVVRDLRDRINRLEESRGN